MLRLNPRDPAVTVDLDIMDDNIRRVQSYVTKHGIASAAHQDA